MNEKVPLIGLIWSHLKLLEQHFLNNLFLQWLLLPFDLGSKASVGKPGNDVNSKGVHCLLH